MSGSSADPAALPGRIADSARREGLFPEPGRALLAVSGGPDSLALLHLFADLGPALGVEIEIAHVDHGIAAESGEWATRVRTVGDGLGVPTGITPLHLGPGTSETVARCARYRALRRMQRTRRARYLVLAHHADDQIETVLYRLLKGSGPAGLAGMPPRGPGGLVRPLLPFGRGELAAWLAVRVPHAAPVADPANRDAGHDRVWVRRQLLPLLRGRFGVQVDGLILAARGQAAEERRAWGALVRSMPDLEWRAVAGGIEVARGVLQRYDNVLSAALLRASARECGCVIGVPASERLLRFAIHADSGRTLPLSGGWVARTVFGRLGIKRAASAPPAPAQVAWGAGSEGEVAFGEWVLRWWPEPADRVTRVGWTTWIAPGDGRVRSWRPGDRVRPAGGVGRRKVRRLLMEARVPRDDRRAYPMVVRDQDILWIPGVCRSDVALPHPGEPAVRLDARRRGNSPTHRRA